MDGALDLVQAQQAVARGLGLQHVDSGINIVQEGGGGEGGREERGG